MSLSHAYLSLTGLISLYGLCMMTPSFLLLLESKTCFKSNFFKHFSHNFIQFASCSLILKRPFPCCNYIIDYYGQKIK